MSASDSLPIELFIQALTTQLDHAQTAMAVKAQNLNLPLTFAVKDLSLDLRTHVEFVQSEVRIRPAGPGDHDASTIRLSLTTITRPMIEENAPLPSTTANEPALRDVVGNTLSDEEQRRLEWAGVQTAEQLRRFEQGGERVLERVANLPVDRLRAALARASQPLVTHVEPIFRDGGGDAAPADAPAAPPWMRIRGRNLTAGGTPRVTIGGEPVSVLDARDGELIVAPAAHQLAGEVVVDPGNGRTAAQAFDFAPARALRAKAPDEGTP
ncbi:hypothetical protein [Burkholderia ubonensis]|uniref:Uncharacterized protein n=1 Tax=Burkholderia ubonensis subsp. mesacidophila TaxID=265293 RepID=A0A2A4EU54_9BURK|nr:hypothetical protein [Burkholderia ubonensis]PCE24671.1 hypothetical protein BZL54_32505 [Burkholderia ubonensis subsp. mesacidophila]